MDHKSSWLAIGGVASFLLLTQVVPTMVSSSDWTQFLIGTGLVILIIGYLLVASWSLVGYIRSKYGRNI